MRSRLTVDNGAVLLGTALLVFSVLGMYLTTDALPPLRSLAGGQANTSPGNRPQKIDVPFPTSPESPTATSTPFLPESPTPTAVNITVDSTPAETGENSFLVPGTPQPTPSPPAVALLPERIVIPAIQLDAPVLPAGYQLVLMDGQTFQQWDAPTVYAAGWQQTSAMLGVPGNTVLYGHHNIYGMVFSRLVDLSEGALIQVFSGGTVFNYEVRNKMILPELGEPLFVRIDNARWQLPTTDERLTLVTCWPEWTNTHRLIIVARPVSK
jgi:LPXTG-site transpeptidase (sortase) family protein